MIAEFSRLVALSPAGDLGGLNALVRLTCAQTLSLPPLPAGVSPGAADAAVVEFAEQFSVDVSSITAEQRARFLEVLGEKAFHVVVLTYVADFVPRVRAGLLALGLGDVLDGSIEWDHAADPADVLFNGFLPAVARLTSLDPVTAEVVRLRGANQHHCQLCKSLREAGALDAGGSEELYADIGRYDGSPLLSDRQKAALRYVDALIWSPGRISDAVTAGVRAHFTDDEAVELTLDVMRNASNKIAVAMAADAPMVEHGTQRYWIMPDGSTEYA